MLDDLSDLAHQSLRLLEALGALTAFGFAIGLLGALVRSVWKALAGGVTLILPFRGDEGAEKVNVILAQQLQQVEATWLELSESLRPQQEEGTPQDSPAFVPLPPAGADAELSERQIEMVRDEPLEGQAIGPISFAGIRVSPEVLFALLYRVRTLLARRTLGGTLHQFGTTVRLAAVFTDRRKDHLTVRVRNIPAPGELLAVIDDVAFDIAKLRLGCTSEAQTWTGYSAFLCAYGLHLRFLRAGHLRDRDKAIEKYREAVEREPTMGLARYNLGTLLYNRYEVTSNREALEHFGAAAESGDEKLQSLGLAGMALAYCQQGHRFGEDPERIAPLADEASARAVAMRPDLEETCYARAFALQMRGLVDDAVEWYTKAIDLEGDTPGERRLKSFASTNRGFLHLTEHGDLDAAEESERLALELFPSNQIAHANLGDINRRRKRYADACAEYEAALALDPRYVNAMNELGMVYVSMAQDEGDAARRGALLDSARQWHEKAVALVPAQEQRQRAELHKRFARSYETCGFHEAASRERSEGDELLKEGARVGE